MTAGQVLRSIGAALVAASLALHFVMVLRYGDNPLPPAPRWPFGGVATEAALLVFGGVLFFTTRGRP